MRTFVRKDFYINPPSTNSNEEEWHKWFKEDNLKARIEKAKFTRASKSENINELPAFSTMKINGVYKQVPSVGFIDGILEPVIEAQQEIDIDKVRDGLNRLHRPGGTRKFRNKSKRKFLRLVKKFKYID